MRNSFLIGMAGILVCLLTVVSGSLVFAETSAVEVQVAPATILIGADQADQITVHAAIAYSIVDTGSVDLNGLSPVATWADDRGELVARFSPAEVEALPEVQALGDVVLTLSGLTEEGAAFSGSDVVRVVVFAAPVSPPGK